MSDSPPFPAPHEREYAEWHVVGFSGGVDSQAAANMVLRHFGPDRVILTYSDVGGWEHDLTTAHVEWFSENVHPVQRITPLVRDLWKTEGFAESKGLDGDATLTMDRLIGIKGRPPSRLNQFCTQYLKLQPTLRWLAETHPDMDYDRWTGVRRDESNRRRCTKDSEWDERFDCALYHPIAAWSKEECFAYCEGELGQRTNPLYRMGFRRVGCAPCIHANRDDLRGWITRFPERIEAVRRLERETGHTFFMPRLIDGKPNTIDDIVDWAVKERGGKQYSLDVLYPPSACSSEYGLCE